MTNVTMSNPDPTVLQEYADNRGLVLRVDRAKGIIAGVKLLGTVSRKGREYPQEVMARALPLYEGMRVNVDHVDPGQRRSLRDRIGLVKNVTLKEDGLYGDFHFNPKHALAEQIAWDAENAPQNLGFSHDTRGASVNRGGKVVVESIDQVLSVDLVANPATTTGLFEDEAGSGEQGVRRIANPSYTPRSEFPAPRPLLPAFAGWQDPHHALSPPAGDTTQESTAMEIKDLTLEQLKKDRPDLVVALQESLEKSDELKALQEELATLTAEKAARDLQESIAGELQAAGLDPANKTHCSAVFLEDLRSTVEPARRKAKIDDRKALVAARPAAVPTSASPLQESHDAAVIPPATAPLSQRLARFYETAPMTWSIRQYLDYPPDQFTTLFVQAWTDVAIDGGLGGIGVLTTDYAGNLGDPLQPPMALVYRNGALWNGVINITRKNVGNFSLDLSFTNAADPTQNWALGDHGEIHVFWQASDSDPNGPLGGGPQWFCAIYYWLVDKPGYEIYEKVGSPVNITTENTIIRSNS